MKINNKILFLILALGIGVNLLIHYYSKKEASQLAIDQAQLEQLTRDVIDIKLLQKDNNELSGEIDNLNKILLKDEVDVANFVLNLEKLASGSATGVEIALDKVKSDSGVAGSKSLGIDISFSGSFESLETYLLEISRMAYLTRIIGIEIVPNKVEVSGIDGNIKMEVFTI